MSQYGQTETFQNLLHMTLEYKCGSIPGAPTFSFIIVPVLQQPWCSLNTPFITILPAMAVEIWTEIWIQVGSSVCIQALARMLQAGWTPHWSSSVEGRASKKRNLEKKIHLAHYFDAFTGSAFYSVISLHLSVSPFLFFKPREHLKDDMSIKSKTISPNVSLVNLGFWRVAMKRSSSVHLKKRSRILFMQIFGFWCLSRTAATWLLCLLLPEKNRKWIWKREAWMQFSLRLTCKQWWQEEVFNNFEEEGRKITRHGLVFHYLIFTTGITGRINKEGYENWQTIEWRVYAFVSGFQFLIFSVC